eukprot:5450533-Pyramimonas_sp.AAC.2
MDLFKKVNIMHYHIMAEPLSASTSDRHPSFASSRAAGSSPSPSLAPAPAPAKNVSVRRKHHDFDAVGRVLMRDEEYATTAIVGSAIVEATKQRVGA